MSNTERSIVAKFGGSSLANAEGFMHVAKIINEDLNRRVIVVSAPGKVKGDSKNFEDKMKITDLLMVCGQLSFRGFLFNNTFGVIERRFLRITGGLGISIDQDLEDIKQGFLTPRENESLSVEWAASRGEWLSGKILARYLGAEFVDATEIMQFQDDGTFNEERSYELIRQRLCGSSRFVVPGFYGRDAAGSIRTFPRGGSDITGSHLAAALNVDVYENWTDVDGVMTADPNIVDEATNVPFLEYEEMAELGLLGAKVLHHSSIDPVWDKGIPIIIGNTFNPTGPKTIIGQK